MYKGFGNKKIQSVYRGEVNKMGLPHGYGILTYYFGGMSSGEFRNGIMWNVKVYDKDGNITNEIENGKIVSKDKSVGVKGKRLKGVLFHRYKEVGWYQTGNEEKDYKNMSGILKMVNQTVKEY